MKTMTEFYNPAPNAKRVEPEHVLAALAYADAHGAPHSDKHAAQIETVRQLLAERPAHEAWDWAYSVALTATLTRGEESRIDREVREARQRLADLVGSPAVNEPWRGTRGIRFCMCTSCGQWIDYVDPVITIHVDAADYRRSSMYNFCSACAPMAKRVLDSNPGIIEDITSVTNHTPWGGSWTHNPYCARGFRDMALAMIAIVESGQ